jgi:hypothetical protein
MRLIGGERVIPTLDGDIASDKPNCIGPNRLSQDGLSRHSIARGRQRAELQEVTSGQHISSAEHCDHVDA